MRIHAKLRCYDAHSDYIYIISLRQTCRLYILILTTQNQMPYGLGFQLKFIHDVDVLAVRSIPHVLVKDVRSLLQNQLVNTDKYSTQRTHFRCRFCWGRSENDQKYFIIFFWYVWCWDKLECRPRRPGRNHLCVVVNVTSLFCTTLSI